MADRILFLETPDIQKTPVGEKNEYTAAEKQKLSGIEAGAQKNTVDSVNGKTGPVTLDASDVGALPSDTPIPAAVTEQTVAGWGFTKNTGTYSKPSGGIPASDLASDVQTSLGKADTALQTAPVTSVNGKTGPVTVNEVPDYSHAIDGQVLTKAQDGPRWANNNPSSGAALRLLYDGAFGPDDPDLMLMGNVADAETGNAIATALYSGRIGSAVLVDVTDPNTEVVYDLFAVDYDAQTHVSTVTFARPEADCIRTATLSGGTKSAPTFGTLPLGGSANAVLYTPQTLTDAQKEQARENVGAASMSDIPSLAAYRTASAQDAIDAAQDQAISGKLSTTGNAYRSASIPMGECDDSSTATVFTATVPGITELRDGVCMWLRNGVITSASGFTININNLGAKPCYSSLAAESRSTTIFNVNYALLMIYNSTRVDGGCWDIVYGIDTNTTYTPPKLGFGYGTCTTAAATVAKTASISSYALTAGGIVSIKFENDVPAGATLNITSKGAKAIYHRGAAITAGVIKAGDTATFVYSTYYHLISIDRDETADLTNYQTKAITDTGGYYTTDTVDGALQEIGAELAGVNTLIGSGVIS